MEIIVGKTAGFCYGVKRAVNGSIEELENSKNQKTYCLGELVHNKEVVLDLEKKWIFKYKKNRNYGRCINSTKKYWWSNRNVK